MPINYGVLHKLMRTKPSVAPTNPYVLNEYIDDGETEKLEARKTQAEKSLAEKPQPEDFKKVLKNNISNLNYPEESPRDHKPRKLAKVRLKTNKDNAH